MQRALESEGSWKLLFLKDFLDLPDKLGMSNAYFFAMSSILILLRGTAAVLFDFFAHCSPSP